MNARMPLHIRGRRDPARAHCRGARGRYIPDVARRRASRRRHAADRGRVARLAEDGTTLQLGIGLIPTIAASMMSIRRNLRVRSEMISDGVLTLHRAGALDPGYPVTSSFLIGSPDLYGWANRHDVLVYAWATPSITGQPSEAASRYSRSRRADSCNIPTNGSGDRPYPIPRMPAERYDMTYLNCGVSCVKLPTSLRFCRRRGIPALVAASLAPSDPVFSVAPSSST